MDTKTCTKCKTTKPLDSFSFSNKTKGTRHGFCKECGKIAGKANYQKNKERYYVQAKKRDKEMRDWIDEQKSVPCADCGGTFDPVCMDFDHLPGHEKFTNISEMRRRRMAWDRIKTEIAKCEVVCSNCHRLRTKLRGLGDF